MNPLITEMMLRERHNEMLEEARRTRLIKAYEEAQPAKKHPILLFFADAMIGLGEMIKRRYEQNGDLSQGPCDHLPQKI